MQRPPLPCSGLGRVVAGVCFWRTERSACISMVAGMSLAVGGNGYLSRIVAIFCTASNKVRAKDYCNTVGHGNELSGWLSMQFVSST